MVASHTNYTSIEMYDLKQYRAYVDKQKIYSWFICELNESGAIRNSTCLKITTTMLWICYETKEKNILFI